jgi:biotin synthase
MFHPSLQRAADLLAAGEPIAPALAAELAALEGGDILALVALANAVRNRFAPGTHLCSIVNAKSGACSENCRFCSQSSHHATGVETYELLDAETLVQRAEETAAAGIGRFGLVTSGFGHLQIDPEFEQALAAIRAIRRRLPQLEVCGSFGVLGPEPVRALADCGISHYNLNLQVAPGRYGALICDTHRVEARLQTVRLLKAHGIGVCCGGIIGVGETMAERLELAFALRELDVDVVPLNVLIPVAGTPLEGRAPTPAAEVAKTFALFRLIHPARTIKFAAGRETVMKDFQGLLLLAGANGMLTGGYLTTRGRQIEEDHAFVRQLAGFGDA